MNRALKYIIPSIGIFAAIFILSILTYCKNRIPDKRTCIISENHDNDLFIFRVVSVENGKENKFIDHLSEIYLPVWSDLQNNGRLIETCVFRLQPLDSMQTENPPRNFLIISHLSPTTSPQQLLIAEKEYEYNQLNNEAFYTFIRSEIMGPSPNSYYPVMASENYEKVGEIEFLVEFIDVNNSPEDLDLYRQLMSSYFGPSNGILVQKNLLFSFTAFETEEIISNTDNEASWNQIHISGDYPEYLDLNWDSLYTDLFRKELSADLDSLWNLLPPIRELPPYYSGHFIKELHLH